MKKVLLIVIVIVSSVSLTFAQSTYYDVTAGNGYGVRLWSNNAYKIHMGNLAEYKYGPVTDYSIKMNMNNVSTRGWTWGISGSTPVAAINTQGKMQIASNFTTYGNIYGKIGSMAYSNLYRFGGLFLTWNSSTYGTQPEHSIRSTYGDTYGDEITINSYNHLRFNIDANNNDPTSYFEVGQHTTDISNVLFRIESPTGNVGIGTTSPNAKLHVTKNGGNGANGLSDFGIVTTASTGQATIGAEGIGDITANLNLGSDIAGLRRFWHISKRTSTTNHALQFYFNDGAGFGQAKVTFSTGGNVGIGTSSPSKLLDVNGDARIGNLNSRQYLKISSSQWPEIRFETPTSDETMRLGVAHEDNVSYGVEEGDVYIYTETVNSMPFIVRKNGDLTFNVNSGSVGIGTTSTGTHKLAVEGSVGAREINVESTGWPDYVFNPTYHLMPLSEVQQFIKKNHRLPDMPSGREVEENGLNLGEMNSKLLKKIEELTLYQIEQMEVINHLNKEIELLKTNHGNNE